MEKAVIYARVSSREQEETGYSLPAQQKLLEEYAAQKGFQVVRVFSVAESASGTKQRKVFAEMMEYMEKKGVSHLLAEKVDRLTRNFKEAIVANDWVEADETRAIHFAKTRLVISKNSKSDEKFRWDIEIVLAKKYISNLSEEVKKGYQEKLAQGGRPGRAPVGYRSVDDGGRKKHVIDETTGPLVRRMFENYASGNYSMERVRQMAFEAGLRGRTGRPLVLSQVAYLMQQPFYYGAIRWNGKMYDFAAHEPLITKETYDRVQDVRTGKKAPKYQKHHFQFRKMLVCGECKGTITAELKKGHVYYHCNHYHECSQKGVTREERIEEQLLGTFKFFEAITPAEAEQIRLKVKASHADEAAYKQAAIAKLTARYEVLRKRRDMLYNDRLDLKINNSTWETKDQEMENEMAEIEAQLARVRGEQTDYFEIWQNILDLAFRAREIYERRSPEEKRLLISHIFSNLSLTDGKVAYSLKTPMQKVFERVQQRLDAEKTFEIVEKRGNIKVKTGEKDSFEPLSPSLRAQ